jgi:hypothetical protein
MLFSKVVQFSLLVKAGNSIKEFNFKKLKNQSEELLDVNVCDERGERIFFNMKKRETNWKIVSNHIPSWVSQNEINLRNAVERELINWR